MTIMARDLGIPARVGVGFLPGNRAADGTVHGHRRPGARVARAVVRRRRLGPVRADPRGPDRRAARVRRPAVGTRCSRPTPSRSRAQRRPERGCRASTASAGRYRHPGHRRTRRSVAAAARSRRGGLPAPQGRRSVRRRRRRRRDGGDPRRRGRAPRRGRTVRGRLERRHHPATGGDGCTLRCSPARGAGRGPRRRSARRDGPARRDSRRTATRRRRPPSSRRTRGVGQDEERSAQRCSPRRRSQRSSKRLRKLCCLGAARLRVRTAPTTPGTRDAGRRRQQDGGEHHHEADQPSHGRLAAAPPIEHAEPGDSDRRRRAATDAPDCRAAVQGRGELRVVRAQLALHLLKYALLVLGQRHRYLRGPVGRDTIRIDRPTRGAVVEGAAPAADGGAGRQCAGTEPSPHLVHGPFGRSGGPRPVDRLLQGRLAEPGRHQPLGADADQPHRAARRGPRRPAARAPRRRSPGPRRSARSSVRERVSVCQSAVRTLRLTVRAERPCSRSCRAVPVRELEQPAARPRPGRCCPPRTWSQRPMLFSGPARARPAAGRGPRRGRAGAGRRPRPTTAAAAEIGRRELGDRGHAPPRRAAPGSPPPPPQRLDRQRVQHRRRSPRAAPEHAVRLRHPGRQLRDGLGGRDAHRARQAELARGSAGPDQRADLGRRPEPSPRTGDVEERLVHADLLHDRRDLREDRHHAP